MINDKPTEARASVLRYNWMQEYYHRKLPHVQPLHGTFFVTYRLHGSLPLSVKQALTEEYELAKRRLHVTNEANSTVSDELSRRYFARFDAVLDRTIYGPTHLRNHDVAKLVADSLHHWDGERIELIAFCIMANHVHGVFTLTTEPAKTGEAITLARMMQSIKSFSGRSANALLQLTGKFWEEESYDRLVRDGAERMRIIRYVLNNPVKAGLCPTWRDWPWTYIKPEYDDF